MKFDHLGLAVSDLARGRASLEQSLLVDRWTDIFHDPVNGVRLQFGRDEAGVVYELLEPLGDRSPVAAALASGKNILNHVAYLVPDLLQAAARLKAARHIATSQPNPAIAYGGARIQFFVSPLKFIVELIEAHDHQHVYMPIPVPAQKQEPK